MSRSVSYGASAFDKSNRTAFHSQNLLSGHSQSQSHGHTLPNPIPIAASVPPDYGTTHASGITLLLADHEKFGFSERLVTLFSWHSPCCAMLCHGYISDCRL